MEKERRITAPDGCEIANVELVDGVAVVTFKPQERRLPKSWEEFCKMYPTKANECYIDDLSEIKNSVTGCARRIERDENLLPDRATAEAILALCQLIQLRNAYNGDWVPEYNIGEDKYCIYYWNGILESYNSYSASEILIFKNAELRDEFLRNFRPLIEKLKPLYGIWKDIIMDICLKK